MENSIYKLKREIFFKTLELLPFENFYDHILEKACKELEISKKYKTLIFPNGNDDFLDMYFSETEKKLISALGKELKEIKGITSKIHQGVVLQIGIFNEHKASFQKIDEFLTLPWNLAKKGKYTWKISDVIWSDGICDTSMDFNFYTKRAILSYAYSLTIKYWLTDNSEDFIDTKQFLHRTLKFITNGAKNVKSFKERWL